MSIGKFFGGPAGGGQKMSKAEALANVIHLEDDRTREKIFFPQEVHQLEQAFDPSTSAVRRGIIASRANASQAVEEQKAIDVARQRAQLTGAPNLGSGSNADAFSNANRSVTRGLQEAGAATDFAVQNAHDNDMMNVVRTGRNMQGGIFQSLGSLADAESTRVEGRSAAKRVREAAKNKAISDSIMGAGGMLLGGYKDSKDMTLKDSQLSPFSRYLRGSAASGSVAGAGSGAGMDFSGY
jgi:hypothetical protein